MSTGRHDWCGSLTLVCPQHGGLLKMTLMAGFDSHSVSKLLAELAALFMLSSSGQFLLFCCCFITNFPHYVRTIWGDLLLYHLCIFYVAWSAGPCTPWLYLPALKLCVTHRTSFSIKGNFPTIKHTPEFLLMVSGSPCHLPWLSLTGSGTQSLVPGWQMTCLLAFCWLILSFPM